MLLPLLSGAVLDCIVLELPLNVTSASLFTYIAPPNFYIRVHDVYVQRKKERKERKKKDFPKNFKEEKKK